MPQDTLLVNLYGGPGAGKSTTAARLFSVLKTSGQNVELVTEHAKDLTWEEGAKLSFQPAVMGEQMWRLERLRGKVDVIVTDTPIMLSCVYGAGMIGHEVWCAYVEEYVQSWPTLNFRVARGRRVWNPAGRSQGEREAIALDATIDNLLLERNMRVEQEISVGDEVGPIILAIREELARCA